MSVHREARCTVCERQQQRDGGVTRTGNDGGGTHAIGVTLSTLAVVAVTALNLAVSAMARYFPYQDSTNHLARYLLIDRCVSGVAPPWVHIRALPTAYVAVDLLGASIAHLTSPRITEGFVAALTLLAL